MFSLPKSVLLLNTIPTKGNQGSSKKKRKRIIPGQRYPTAQKAKKGTKTNKIIPKRLRNKGPHWLTLQQAEYQEQ